MHVVYWGSLPAHLLQSVATYPALIGAVAKALDGMVRAEVDPIIQSEQLVDKLNGIIPPKPSQWRQPPNPWFSSVSSRRSKTVVICNCHSDSQTCRVGKVEKKSCRMRRPQPLVEQTTCTQIEPTIDGNGMKSYKTVSPIEPPKIDSQRSRNISRLPIPIRYKRLIMWEIGWRSISLLEEFSEWVYGFRLTCKLF